MCHRGVFERTLGPVHSHTHTCAARGLRASAPSRVCPSNSHDANVSHPLYMVSHLSRVGCNTLSPQLMFYSINPCLIVESFESFDKLYFCYGFY